MSPFKYVRAFYRTNNVYQDDVITLTAAEELDVDSTSTTVSTVTRSTTTTKVNFLPNIKSISHYYFIFRRILLIFAILSFLTYIIVTGVYYWKVKIDYGQELKHRRTFVRSMARSAWNAYKKHAWSHGALKPNGRRPMPEVDLSQKPGYTILSAMSTLKVMGLEEEYAQGRDWILSNRFEERLAATPQYLIVDWPINAYIGSLMSLYALTGEEVFRDKAVAVEKILEPAFDSKTGLLHLELNPLNQTAKTKINNDVEDEIENGNKANNFLFFIGHQSPAFLYLADSTGNSKLKARLKKIFETVKTVEKPDGLYFEAINVKTGKWSRSEVVDAEHSVFFFNDLIQSYIMQAGNNKEALTIFADAIQAMVNVSMFQEVSLKMNNYDDTDLTNGTLNITFFSRYHYKERRVEKASMTSPACIFGAVLALGSKELEKQFGSSTQSVLFWSLAIELMNTCRLAALSTETGLIPQSFTLFSSVNYEEVVAKKDPFQGRYFLDANYVQSLFVLWRYTKNEQYRKYAWEYALAIQKHCSVMNENGKDDEGGGYSDIEDVNVVPTHYLIDYQSPQFISATLKYLYLIFEEDDVLPLDKWIFTDAGQALPICGQHERYPKFACS